LEYIGAYANSFCQKPELTGGSTTLEGSLTLKAGFDGLKAKLISLGGEIGVRAQRVTWEGIGQDQLGEAVASGNNCAATVMQVLGPLLVPMTGPRTGDRPPFVTFPFVPFGLQSPILLYQTYGTAEQCAEDQFVRPFDPYECRRLPERVPCFYTKTAQHERLTCHWTMAACEMDYFRNRPLGGVGVRCEETGWTEALTRFRAIEERRLKALFGP
jgi:hypothetical protein